MSEIDTWRKALGRSWGELADLLDVPVFSLAEAHWRKRRMNTAQTNFLRHIAVNEGLDVPSNPGVSWLTRVRESRGQDICDLCGRRVDDGEQVYVSRDYSVCDECFGGKVI